MSEKIDQKIVKAEVKKEEDVPTKQVAIVGMHEGVERPELLHGITYKFKNPSKEFAVYVTINDTVIDGHRYPYEIFMNCKDPESIQWVHALTRVISAIFRKGGDYKFLVKELLDIYDPKGGAHIKKGMGFINSDVAEIGLILQQHIDYLDKRNGYKDEHLG